MNRKNLKVSAGKALLGLSAALLVSGASHALAQQETCPVTFTTNATTIRSLQLDVDHAGAPAGDFAVSSCTGFPPGLGDANYTGASLELGWADTAPFAGGDFVTCSYVNTSGTPGGVDPADFDTIVLACDKSIGVPCAPAATIAVSVGACTASAPACGNGVLEPGEACDGGAGCTDHCTVAAASCPASPLAGCKVGLAGGSKFSFKADVKKFDNAKDSGAYQWKKGAATAGTEFGNATMVGAVTYSWCVYDQDGLAFGIEIPSGGTCDGAPCWSGDSEKGYKFKNKTGAGSGGVSGASLKPGDADKASISLKAKSKEGNFNSPALPLEVTPAPLGGTVTSQFIVDTGLTTVCFETDFAVQTKNEAKGISSKGP